MAVMAVPREAEATEGVFLHICKSSTLSVLFLFLFLFLALVFHHIFLFFFTYSASSLFFFFSFRLFFGFYFRFLLLACSSFRFPLISFMTIIANTISCQLCLIYVFLQAIVSVSVCILKPPVCIFQRQSSR